MAINSTAALQHLIDKAHTLPSATPRDVMRFAIAGYLLGSLKYSEDQPRDESGRWSDTGSGGGGGSSGGDGGSGGNGGGSFGERVIIKDVPKSIDSVRQKTRSDKKEHGAMLDSDGNHITSDFKGTGSSIRVPADQMVKGGIFIHSHPYDVSFSPDDLYLAATSETKSWVVVGDKHTYIVEKTESTKPMTLARAKKAWGKYIRETDDMTRDIRDFDEIEFVSTDYASGKLAREMGLTYSSKKQ